METIRTHPVKTPHGPHTRPAGAAAWAAARPEETPEQPFVRLDCSLCDARFVLDVAEHWSREPQEMELVGRRFLDVPLDAVLCPRCLHEVELTGAERIYWARAG